MTQEEDIETVKRAADAQNRRHRPAGESDKAATVSSAESAQLRTWCCHTLTSGPHATGCGFDPSVPIDYNGQAVRRDMAMGYNEDQAFKKYQEVLKDTESEQASYDAVNPPHYQRGPTVMVEHACAGSQVGQQEYTIQAIDVFRHIKDPRLATAFRYLWRAAFGGKRPDQGQTQYEKNVEDIKKAIWYLNDYTQNEVS